MKRKLIFLDVLLVGVLAWAGVQFRAQWLAARAREANEFNRKQAVLPPPPYTRAVPEPPVVPAGYKSIADSMLYDPSRNPTVVIETPPAPPPPPMPPLPEYHGSMSLGGAGLTAFFSQGQNGVHQAVHPGEMIGQFKFVDVNSEEVTLEWNGQVVHKPLAEIRAKASASAQESAAVRTDVPPPAAAAAPPPPVKSGPGEDTAFGFKTCRMDDGQADGAVMEGYRKTMHATPFGKTCTWEPLGK